MGGKKKQQQPPPEPEKLMTSDVVYKKVMWHPDVDKDVIQVGYLDRFLGLKWMPLKKWRMEGGDAFDDIPYHRVVAFTAKGVEFWNRDKRMCKVDDLFSGELLRNVVDTPAAPIEEESGAGPKQTRRQFPRTDLINFRTYSEAAATWKRTTFEPPGNVPPHALPREIKFLTWNVLFGKYDFTTINCPSRWAALLEAVQEHSPDILCLQETDESFTEILLDHPYIKENYVITDHQCMQYGPDSIILVQNNGFLSPIDARLHQFNPNVNAVIVEVVVGGRSIGVCSLHLTSERAANSQGKRGAQIEAIFSLMHKYDHAFIAGDFNIGDGPENEAIDWGRYKDSWVRIHGASPSSLKFTFDPATNPLAAFNTVTSLAKRMDRIFYRSKDDCIVPSAATLTGDDTLKWEPKPTPVSPEDTDEPAKPAYHPTPPPYPSLIPPDVQVQFIIRGLQRSGKTTLARALLKVFGGVVVSLDDKAAGYPLLRKVVGDPSVNTVIVDGAHLTTRQLDMTTDVLGGSHCMGYSVLLDVMTTAEVVVGRMKGKSRIGERAGEVVAATVCRTDEPKADVANSIVKIDGVSSVREWISAIRQNLTKSGVIIGREHDDVIDNLQFATPTETPIGNSFPITPPSDHYGVLLEFNFGTDDGAAPATKIERPIDVYTGMFSRSVALAVVLPEYPAERIGVIRRDLDKAVKTWPCHVNIMWPFIPMTAYLEKRGMVEEAIREGGLKPFRLTVSELKAFNDYTRNRASLWLDPVVSDKGCLGRVRKGLEKRFVDGNASAAHGFNPHMTVGRTTPDKVTSTAKQYCWDGSKPITVTITHLTVLSRVADGEPMLPVDEIPLLPEDDSAVQKARYDLDSPWTTLDTLPHRQVPKQLLEPHPLGGNKELPQYTPKDPLENFMLHLTSKMARLDGTTETLQVVKAAPTHISQKGGMYHIPPYYVNEYLAYWEKSRGCGEAFYMEEIRGSVFRLYIDVDVKLTGGRLEGSTLQEWLKIIVKTVKTYYKTPTCMFVMTECHGEWSCDDPDVKSKSGYRLYFLDLYTAVGRYRGFMEELAAAFKREVSDYEGRPGKSKVDDVIDAHSVTWERGRLIGTVKRRKDLVRIYQLQGVYHSDSDGEVTIAKGFTDHLNAHGEELCYATTLRMWDLPNFARLADSIAPEPLSGYHYAVVVDGSTTSVVDLIQLRTKTFSQQAHTPKNAIVVGYDRPDALSKYPFVCITAIAGENGEPPSAAKVIDSISLTRSATKADIKTAEWRRMLVSETVHL